MKSVLVPIDATSRSLDVLRATVREGAGAIERIELLSVQPLFNRHISRWISRGVRDQWRAERAAAALEPAKRIVEAAGIPYRTHVATGPAPAAIAATARNLRCDEIAQGAYGAVKPRSRKALRPSVLTR
ncbi:MAG TPA: universal stress protein [Usitatibacter sp.]|nr:universal stress protein [Usitatibacter sp.]